MNNPQASQQYEGLRSKWIPLGIAIIMLAGLFGILASIPPERALASNGHAPTTLANDNLNSVGMATGWQITLPYRIYLPLVMDFEKTGEKINIFYSGSQTFAANQPFRITHGFAFEPTDEFTELNDFRLQVDGVYREEDFIEAYLDVSSNPPLIHKNWVLNFPNGMQGVHTFTGHWLAPCVQVYEDCAVPEEIVESRLSNVAVTFIP